MAYNYLKKIAYFYPRPPRGGRPENYTPEASWSVISIHALREEGDAHGASCWMRHRYFYPRPPRGGRRLLR